MDGTQSSGVDLVPELAGYSISTFVLRVELDHIVAVKRAEAPEAVVFYCARILESLAGEALRRLGQSPSPNVFSNLQLLEQLNRLGTVTRYWAHTLRRLGNQVRHVGGLIGALEADLAILFAEGVMEWFFCRFSHGYRLPSLTSSARTPILPGGGEGLRSLLRHLEALEAGLADPHAVSAVQAAEQNSAFLETPVLAAVLADILLSRGERLFTEVRWILETALLRFPEDLRLRQLLGLFWSRQGQPEEALKCVEPLHARFPDDDETAGILAGAYKRKWLQDRADRAALEKSYRAYRQGWKASGRKNAYLGINAATTALFLGLPEATSLGREVEDLLQTRAATLPRGIGDGDSPLQYWDRVTLAETQLLRGDLALSDRTYAAAFARHEDRSGDIEVSRNQRDEILKALGHPPASASGSRAVADDVLIP